MNGYLTPVVQSSGGWRVPTLGVDRVGAAVGGAGRSRRGARSGFSIGWRRCRPVLEAVSWSTTAYPIWLQWGQGQQVASRNGPLLATATGGLERGYEARATTGGGRTARGTRRDRLG